ncbi:asparagine synthase-related protein [Microbacterium arabinogalactanolyticum]|uniref:asparagine synthase-related protein n=1 Tax=Microbacterium arabinogalactanolyticum TaxID=69365 RepID=UPI00404447D6
MLDRWTRSSIVENDELRRRVSELLDGSDNIDGKFGLIAETSSGQVAIADHLARENIYYNTLTSSFAFEVHEAIDALSLDDRGMQDALRWEGASVAPGPRTPIAGLRRVPPGCIALSDKGGLRLRRYWPPPAAGRLALRHRDLSALIEESVGHLTESRCCFAVSGGVDSSAIAIAAKTIRPTAEHIAITIEHEHRIARERLYQDSISALLSGWTLVRERTTPTFAPLSAAGFSYPGEVFAGSLVSGHEMRAMVNAAEAHNAATLVMGIGGDELFTPTAADIARHAIRWPSRHTQAITLLKYFSSLPNWNVRTMVRVASTGDEDLGLTNLPSRASTTSEMFDSPAPAIRWHRNSRLHAILRRLNSNSIESAWNPILRRNSKVQIHNPLMDKHICDAILYTPHLLVEARSGLPKGPLREILRNAPSPGHLIASRQTKAVMSGLLTAAVHEHADVFTDSQLVARRIVPAGALQKYLDELSAGVWSDPHIFSNLLSAEEWLRTSCPN